MFFSNERRLLKPKCAAGARYVTNKKKEPGSSGLPGSCRSREENLDTQ
jgi:hypothetical protein